MGAACNNTVPNTAGLPLPLLSRLGAVGSPAKPASSSTQQQGADGSEEKHVTLVPGQKSNVFCIPIKEKARVTGKWITFLGDWGMQSLCFLPRAWAVLSAENPISECGMMNVLCPTGSWALIWPQVSAMSEPLGRHHPKCCLGAGCVPLAPSWCSCVGCSTLKAVRWDWDGVPTG